MRGALVSTALVASLAAGGAEAALFRIDFDAELAGEKANGCSVAGVPHRRFLDTARDRSTLDHADLSRNGRAGGRTEMTPNLDVIANQRIRFSAPGVRLDTAHLLHVEAGGTPASLGEVVDNVNVSITPVPTGLPLLAGGLGILAALAAACRPARLAPSDPQEGQPPR